MRLWTIQAEEIWARAEESGVLECNGITADKAIDSWFRPAYDWMVRQLEQRLKNYPGSKYPIWAWYYPKPDLRHSGHLPRGTSGVRIEFIVSPDRVLLSDFETWHAVLLRPRTFETAFRLDRRRNNTSMYRKNICGRNRECNLL